MKRNSAGIFKMATLKVHHSAHRGWSILSLFLFWSVSSGPVAQARDWSKVQCDPATVARELIELELAGFRVNGVESKCLEPDAEFSQIRAFRAIGEGEANYRPVWVGKNGGIDDRIEVVPCGELSKKDYQIECEKNDFLARFTVYPRDKKNKKDPMSEEMLFHVTSRASKMANGCGLVLAPASHVYMRESCRKDRQPNSNFNHRSKVSPNK